MIKKIEVANRKNVNFFSSLIYNQPHVVISINSAGSNRVTFSNSQYRRNILFLQFDDTHFNDWRLNDAIFCNSFLDGLKKDKNKLSPNEKAVAEDFIERVFNQEQAKEIKDFIDTYRNKVELVVSQCHAGISRSSAVAAALSTYLKIGDPSDYFDNPSYSPNVYVYNVLKTILAGKEIEKLKLRYELV